MRVVITGGSGLIGRALVSDLSAAGYETVVLSRWPERVGGLPAGARAVGWDGASAAGWGELAAGAAIVNLAGANLAAGRWTVRRKRLLSESRLRATAAVVAVAGAVEPRPAVLLQSSAVGYYGPTGDEPIAEEHAPGDDFLSRLCVAWEDASGGVEEAGVRRVLLRTGVVLATEGGALPKMALPFRLFAGGPVGDGRQWLAWIHLADMVGAMRFLLESDEARGAFNLSAPTPVTNRDLAHALGRVLHRPSILPTPAFALRLALGEMASVLLTGQRAVPQRLLAAGYRFRFTDLEAALADLLA
jgi:uncharacterized protein